MVKEMRGEERRWEMRGRVWVWGSGWRRGVQVGGGSEVEGGIGGNGIEDLG